MSRGPRGGALARVLAFLLVALAPGVWGAPGDSAAVDPNPSSTRSESAEREVDELRQRVQGMGGKLKESAAARKGADQARMDAERRLAVALQEKGHLEAEAGRLRDLNAALDTSLKECQDHASRLAEGQAAAEERTRQALGERDGLRALLPVSEGGTLTLDAAHRHAGDAATTLRRALAQLKGPRDAEGQLAVSEAEQQLSRCQTLVALASGARGLYRVRPSDSLGQVAGRFYGDGGRWVEIRNANRHVISDPNRLIPGMTLVIP